MAKSKQHQEAGAKGGKATGPHKNGYFREMLEKYVFESEAKFATWVDDNFTDAVKELGKLQPKDMKVSNPDGGPLLVERIIVDKTTDTDS